MFSVIKLLSVQLTFTGLKFLSTRTMKIAILEEVMPCRLENRYKGFAGIFCLHFLGAVIGYFSIIYSIMSHKTSMCRPNLHYVKNSTVTNEASN
jgi:TRAP-type C4-dicarboxylate transport system permease small subunit